MKLQEQPNRWSCGMTSLSMLLSVPFSQLVSELGHDGSEIIATDLPEPLCRRGFMIDDLQDLCYRRGCGLVPFDFPLIGDTGVPVYTPEQAESRILQVMPRRRGLIEGSYSIDKPHLVAWDGFQVFDPTGPRQYTLFDAPSNIEKITVQCFWMLVRI